eukprot:296839-Amphidinium_carterae.1
MVHERASIARRVPAPANLALSEWPKQVYTRMQPKVSRPYSRNITTKPFTIGNNYSNIDDDDYYDDRE